MALLPETEPLLSRFSAGREKIKIFQFLVKSKNYLTEKGVPFLNIARKFLIKFNCVGQIKNFFLRIKETWQTEQFRNFFVNISLSHLIIIFIALVVFFSNISDKVTIRRFYSELIYVDPASEYSIAQSVGQYTPLIPRDEEIVHKMTVAVATTGGFANNVGPIETLITSREEPLPDNSTSTAQYVIRDGDTLTALGWKFDVKLATIKYVNDLSDVDVLRPGVKLKIPPRGYEVAPSLIAKREKEKSARLALANRSTVTRDKTAGRAYASSGNITVDRREGSRNNGYPYGYCTYYVATRRSVPANWGNAKSWLDSARRAGYSTGSTPAAGAIVVTKESWWGHVAYVEDVDGDKITIAEMNARGWGVTSRRTISTDDSVVRGFIY